MLFGSVRGRINLIRPLLSNRIFPGVFSASDSLFRFLIPPPSSSSVVAKKTIDSVVTTESVLNSVVKINCFSSRPNIFCPWQNKPQEKSNGSGFVISGKKIITNAHLVANNILVQVRKHGSQKKYIAKVEAIGYESDLASLVIENEEFWEDMNPLELGDIPFLKDSVVVVGYPKGGESISITKGVVSRIDSRQYFRGTTNLPVIQTDADLNPGNSGGPVFIGNKVVGVAFQHLQHYKNIGYLIPTSVVRHFITGQNVGFCSLNLSYQSMEDAHIRSHFKMNSKMTGVLVYSINQHSDAQNILKKYDIILSIDGVAIENDGTVILRNRERMTLDHLVSMKQLGEKTTLKVLREEKMHEFSITLKPVQKLVHNIPSYYIFAGFVFVSHKKQGIKGKFAYKNMFQKAGEENVIISQVLVDEINVAYEMFKHLKVKRVNNVEVKNLKHLYQLIEKCCTKDLRLDLEDDRVIILDYQSAKNSTSLILERHRVPWAMSKDLID